MYPVPPFLTDGPGAMTQAFFGLISSIMVARGVAAQHVQPCPRNPFVERELVRAAGLLAVWSKAGGVRPGSVRAWACSSVG